MKKLSWIVLLAFVCLVAKEPASSTYTAYNGKLFIAHSSKPNPVPLELDGRKIAWLNRPKLLGQKIALVPVSYHTKLSALKLSKDITLVIKQAQYKKESIVVTDRSKLYPNKQVQKRIDKERDEARAIYQKTSEKRYWRQPFAHPVKRVFITSPFGTARVFNGAVQSYHGGVDFRAPQGTPIYAANDGVVVLAKDRFLSGKSVIIDHGQGVYTTYFHNSRLLVRAGKFVRKGEKIALSGATGRVSGAHLHFGVVCNGVQVDPLDFIKQINALFAS